MKTLAFRIQKTAFRNAYSSGEDGYRLEPVGVEKFYPELIERFSTTCLPAGRARTIKGCRK